MAFHRTFICAILFCLWMVTASWVRDCRFANFRVQPNFKMEKYMGKWYEMKWLAPISIPDEVLFQDYTHNYVLESDGTIRVFMTGRDPAQSNRCFRIDGLLTQTKTPGKMRFSRPSGLGSPEITSDYWVIMTDYDNYAFVYGCRVPFENGTCNEADSWVWSRTQSLPGSTLKLITRKMKEVCVDPEKYLVTKQENECPVCRYKLTEVVKNFDIMKYTGNWYQLRIYKQNAANGFTPKNAIHSYEVRDPTRLDLMISYRNMGDKCFRGSGFLHKTDSFGKLTLDLNIALGGHIERDYWILWTDYVNYSVVYSCVLPGANFTCSQPELTVMGRTTSLSPTDWEMVNEKVINVCLDPNDYVDIHHDQGSD